MNSISWRSVEREKLPELLLNERHPNELIVNCSEADIYKNKISLAYHSEEHALAQQPSTIVLAQDVASDVFSWLRVYAPETFPLSQITRVITVEDWELTKNPNRSHFYKATNDQWACLTLGEMLAQGDSDTEISSIPLSRANACFSSTIAKTAKAHQSPELMNTCIERLIKLEKEKRFVSRLVTIDTLKPIWDLFEKSCINDSDITEIVNDLHQLYRTKSGTIRKYILPELRNYQGLYSDSIEDRVITFNEIATQISKSSAITGINIYTSAFLAASAFLVGRGTSHLFLLRKFSTDYPSAFVWFGFFAANAGSELWDPEWVRATKSIGRSLRQKLDWANPLQVDLCWAEFTWLSSNIDREGVFSELPKLYPKVLSIEILPGTSCQFRIANSAPVVNEDRIREQQAATQLNYELQKTLTDLANLAIRAKNIFDDEYDTVKSPFNLDGNPPQKYPHSKRGTARKLTDNDQNR